MDTKILFQACMGHRLSARHPNVSHFLMPRMGCAIDLFKPEHVLASLFQAKERLNHLRAQNKTLLWVGDHRSAKLLDHHHQQTGEAVIHHRWPGGLLTNFDRVSVSRKGKLNGLGRCPQVLVVLSMSSGFLAVQEAQQCGIEVVALVDSNQDPKKVGYPIFCNDDGMSVLGWVIENLS